MAALKILNTLGDAYCDEARLILERIGEVDFQVINQAELEKVIDKYDVIFLGLYPELNDALLKKAKKLKVITTATTNLDHVDLETARSKNIAVLSLTEEIEFLKIP